MQCGLFGMFVEAESHVLQLGLTSESDVILYANLRFKFVRTATP